MRRNSSNVFYVWLSMFLIGFSIIADQSIAQPNLQWSNVYGTISPNNVFNGRGLALAECADGGWLLVWAIDQNSTSNLQLTRLNPYGEVLWQKIIPGVHDTAGIRAELTVGSILQRQGGFLLAGTVARALFPGYQGFNDGFVAAIDTAGNLQWAHCYGGSGADELDRIVADSEGGYEFVGWTASAEVPGVQSHLSAAQMDIWVGKIDSLGNLLWMHGYGGTGPDLGVSIAALHDHTITILARTASNDGDISQHDSVGYERIWIAHLDSAGNKLWDRSLTSRSGMDIGEPIAVEPEGNGDMIATGTEVVSIDSAKRSWEYRTYVERISSSGATVWLDSIPEEDRFTHMGAMPGFGAVDEAPNGDIVIANYDNDWYNTTDGQRWIWLAKFNSNGERKWFMHRAFPIHVEASYLWWPIIPDVRVASDGGFAVVGYGYRDSNSASMDALPFAGRFPPDVEAVSTASSDLEPGTFFASPNPAENFINIKISDITSASLRLYNPLGVCVLDRAVTGNAAKLDVSAIPRGVYYLELRAEGKVEGRSVLLR